MTVDHAIVDLGRTIHWLVTVQKRREARGNWWLVLVLVGCVSFAGCNRVWGQEPGDGPLLLRSQPRWDLQVMASSAGQTPIDSIETWEQRRDLVLSAMQHVMGELPAGERPDDLNVQVIDLQWMGEVAKIELTYESQLAAPVPAFLFVPRSHVAGLPFAQQLVDLGSITSADETASNSDSSGGSPRLPAMLCLHPTEDRLGHRVVTGIPERPTMGYALELAQRGYVTLAPAYPLLANYQPDLVELGWRSGSMKAIWDNSRAVDLLESIEFVDGERIGAIGHSLGGHNSVYTAVLEPRIKVIVSSCGLDAYVDYYDGNDEVWEFGRGWCQSRYIPDLARYRGNLEAIPYDFPELIASLAPRHVLIVAPIGDDNFRYASVDRIESSAGVIFELYQARDHLKVLHPEGPHDFSDPMRQAAYEWIDRALKSR